MVFFSGFCFDNEYRLFEKLINFGDYNVCGFSYGGIKAVEYALSSDKRIDTLQLFSPAFFNDKDDKFIRLQLMYFKTEKAKYIKTFFKNIGASQDDYVQYFKEGTINELKELLTYSWDIEKIKNLRQKGINLEIFLGQNDKIVDINKIKDFFEQYATVYILKDVGHLLK